jgi:hypothetical protein
MFFVFNGKGFWLYTNIYMASENYESGNTSRISSFSDKNIIGTKLV